MQHLALVKRMPALLKDPVGRGECTSTSATEQTPRWRIQHTPYPREQTQAATTTRNTVEGTREVVNRLMLLGYTRAGACFRLMHACGEQAFAGRPGWIGRARTHSRCEHEEISIWRGYRHELFRAMRFSGQEHWVQLRERTRQASVQRLESWTKEVQPASQHYEATKRNVHTCNRIRLPFN